MSLFYKILNRERPRVAFANSRRPNTNLIIFPPVSPMRFNEARIPRFDLSLPAPERPALGSLSLRAMNARGLGLTTLVGRSRQSLPPNYPQGSPSDDILEKMDYWVNNITATALGDRRSWHPQGKSRPMAATNRIASTVAPVNLGDVMGFNQPDNLVWCVQRKLRREVLLAKGHGGGRHKKVKPPPGGWIQC